MRFAVGQAFERFADNRQAVVTQIRDGATLGYFASSITGTSIGFSGRNSVIVSNGSHWNERSRQLTFRGILRSAWHLIFSLSREHFAWHHSFKARRYRSDERY